MERCFNKDETRELCWEEWVYDCGEEGFCVVGSRVKDVEVAAS